MGRGRLPRYALAINPPPLGTQGPLHTEGGRLDCSNGLNPTRSRGATPEKTARRRSGTAARSSISLDPTPLLGNARRAGRSLTPSTARSRDDRGGPGRLVVAVRPGRLG